MKALLFQFLQGIRASYWFVPAMMALAALVLSFGTITADERIGSDWPEDVAWMYSNKPDGARSLLATVAGSMITVAGITFSLTLLAVSHTTSQFGPRLLTNFMRDRGNQFTLGTFIATFLYCLMILRTVRAADEATGDVPPEELLTAFVPHISITVALALTVCSVGVLIYFFHHVPESMNLSNVVAKVGRQLVDATDEAFPEMAGENPPRDREDSSDFTEIDDDAIAVSIGDRRDGFVQTLNADGLMELATRHDVVVRLHFRPGDFISRGQTVYSVRPVDSVEDELAAQLRECVALGVYATPHQNLLFVVDQLVEVAARSLSPGVNDPFSAIVCMQWLGNALTEFSRRNDPDSHRYDEEGELRIIAPAVTFREVCDVIFDKLRPYFATDRNAAIAMMRTIDGIRSSTSSPARRTMLCQHADRLIDAAAAALSEYDMQQLRACDGRDV